jgi:hypothetical protein
MPTNVSFAPLISASQMPVFSVSEIAARGKCRRSTLPQKHLLGFTLGVAINQLDVGDHRLLPDESERPDAKMLKGRYCPEADFLLARNNPENY